MTERVRIREERPGDIAAIRRITAEAFRGMPYSSQTEAAIVDALRDAGALAVSLVAVEDGDVVGHVAFSPVRIGGADAGWFGLGPVSVRPDRQTRGIGTALIETGLARLKRDGAPGCVLVGAPGYYGRFGFENDPDLRYADAPAEYLLRLALGGSAPSGEVGFHPAFYTSGGD